MDVIMMGTKQVKYIRKLSLLFIGIFFSMIIGCGKKVSAPPAPSVPAIKITPSIIPLYKDYIGITQSIASVAIRARVEGFLLQKHFTEGTLVKKDQLLYVIDQRPYEAQLLSAEGTLARNIADEEFQKVEYVRMKELVKKGDVSQSEYDKVSAQYKAAVASVEVAKAQLEQAKINLSYCSMTSPFDGLIGKRYVDLGNLVGGGEKTLLVNVVQLNPMYVEFSPSVSDFSEFLKHKKNMPFDVKITLPYSEKVIFKGKVDLVNNEADIPTSTILMRAIIDNPDNLLRPGIYVNLNLILTTNEKVMLIPSKAVLETQGKKSVFVINDKNQIEVRDIETSGQYQEQSIIGSGINVGDIVVTDNLQKMRPGQPVTPIFAEQTHG